MCILITHSLTHSPPPLFTQVIAGKADSAAVLVSPETTPDIANLVTRCLGGGSVSFERVTEWVSE